MKPTVPQTRAIPGGLRLRSRGSLVAAMVALQGAVLAGGWVVLSVGAEHNLSERSASATLDQNKHLVKQVVGLLRERGDGRIVEGSPAWVGAQDLIEAFSAPAGTSVFVLDAAGRVLCHPDLSRNANVRRMDYGELPLRSESGSETTLGSLRASGVVTGQGQTLAGDVLIATVKDDRLGVRVVAMTPEASAIAAARGLMSGVLVWTGAVGACVLGVTVAGSWLLTRRYDTMLGRINKQLETEVDRRTRKGLATRNSLIFGLAKLADYRDTDTGTHLDRICRYCELLAAELAKEHPRIDRGWIERLKLASSMHDIGKVGIPDAILLKPGALTPEERRVMEQHPVIGAETLTAIRDVLGDDDLLSMGIEVTLQHHERWDGTGYPFRLKGERIALSARIVALADIYDALTSKRVYKDAMGHGPACEIIRKLRGTHLDPAIVDAFLRIETRFDEVRRELQPANEDDAKPRLLMALEQMREAVARNQAA